jgi:hypothetical protein
VRREWAGFTVEVITEENRSRIEVSRDGLGRKAEIQVPDILEFSIMTRDSFAYSGSCMG